MAAGEGQTGPDAIADASVDLVVVDIFMPGMDGLETITELHRAAFGIPIIALSGFTFRDSSALRAQPHPRARRGARRGRRMLSCGMAAAPDKSTDKHAWRPARPPGDGGTVVPLRPRPGRAWRVTPHADPNTAAALGDLSRYERRGDDDDDYRHRMIANVAALAFTALLVVCGLWIANTMAEMRKNQDCVLSGKRNCTPVEVPAR